VSQQTLSSALPGYQQRRRHGLLFSVLTQYGPPFLTRRSGRSALDGSKVPRPDRCRHNRMSYSAKCFLRVSFHGCLRTTAL
jgi:hypothetical protein